MHKDLLFHHIRNLDGKTISSSFPKEIGFEKITNTSVQTTYCEIYKTNRRQLFFKLDECHIYFCSYSQTITNTIFKHYCNAFKLIVPKLIENYVELQNSENKKARRLKHNLITHCSRIQQELYNLVPQENIIKGKTNQLEYIKDALIKKSNNAAYAFLRILKNVNFMKAEFDVFDMLNKKNSYIDFQNHNVYKVIHLAITPFWLDYLEKYISVQIDSSSKIISLDYKSFSVSLCHIFDNSVKYCMPHSEYRIFFEENNSKFSIIFQMQSLKVEVKELDLIFQEEYSGEWAEKTELSGNGVGMSVIRSLLLLNNFNFQFINDFTNTGPTYYDGIPYENNKLIISQK